MRSRGPGRRPFTTASFVTASLASGVVSAEEGLPLRIEMVAPECPSDALSTLTAEVRARVRRPLVIQSGSASAEPPRSPVQDATAAVLRIRMDRARERIRGYVSFEGVAGRDERAVEGENCTEVAQALAFIASAWVEAEPEGKPAAGAHASLEPQAETAARRPTAVEVPAKANARARSAPSLRVGWRTGVASGFVGRPAIEAAATAAYAIAGGRHELRGGLRLARARDVTSLGDATFVWVTIPVDGCENFTVKAFTAGLCARIEPGVFHASLSGAYGFEATHILAWLDLGAGLRAGIDVGRFRLEVEGFTLIPVTGYRIEQDRATLAGFRTVAVSIGVGATLPIR